ncbi:MAG TPA: lipopolysaccharide biosynthesis protein [Gemmatimonadales bacterium]|nr:lipopolysaccharide biosynthesis protein [Gemmatimonadales bacterium]
MFWTFSGTGVQVVFRLLSLMALGRLLTPAEFGLVGAVMVVVALSETVSQIGVGPAIVQRQNLEQVHVRVAVTLSCTLGLVLGAAVWFNASAIAGFYRIPEVEPLLRGAAFLFPIDGLSTVGKSLLIRNLRFRLYVALDVASYIIGFATISVLLAWYGLGAWALMLAYLAQAMLRAMAMYLATRHSVLPSGNLKAAGDLLSFGFGHSLAQIGTVLSQQGDNFVVGRWLGPAALGVYGRAYNLMVMPAYAFGKVVNRVLFPIMSQVQDQRDRLARGYERALAVVALVSLPVGAFLWVVAPEFVLLVLGPAWGAVVLPFRLLTISLLFRMSSRISDACAKAAGVVYRRALLQGMYAGAVVLGAIAGQRWGVAGVAVAVSGAMALNWLSMAWLGRGVTGLSWSQFARAHIPAGFLAVLIGAAAVAAAQGARAAHLGQHWTFFAAALASAGAAYGAVRLLPDLFLGQHGRWAYQQGSNLIRRNSRRAVRRDAVSPDHLASAREPNSQ